MSAHAHLSPWIFDVDYERFAAEVLEASRTTPVLVDFWAEWCPPCRALTPVLERVVLAHAGHLLLAKVEVDEGQNMKLAGRYGLKGFPTVLLFSEGAVQGRFSGAKSEHGVRAFLAEHGVETPR